MMSGHTSCWGQWVMSPPAALVPQSDPLPLRLFGLSCDVMLQATQTFPCPAELYPVPPAWWAPGWSCRHPVPLHGLRAMLSSTRRL